MPKVEKSVGAENVDSDIRSLDILSVKKEDRLSASEVDEMKVDRVMQVCNEIVW